MLEQWIEIGPGDYPEWSPAGNRLYFLSPNSELLQTIELDARSMQPVSAESATIHRFSQGEGPRDLLPGTFRISVAPDRILFNAARRESE